MSFKETSLKILKDSEEFDDNIQNIFEIVFGVFMETVQISSENHLTKGQIKSRVFNKLFGPMKNANNPIKCSTNSKIDEKLLNGLKENSFKGFNPNESFNASGVDAALLSKLKGNINKVRKQDLKDNFKKIKKDFEKE